MKKIVYLTALSLAMFTVACGQKENVSTVEDSLDKEQGIVEDEVNEEQDVADDTQESNVLEGIPEENTAEPGELQIAYEDYSDQVTGEGDVLLLSVSENVPVVEIVGQEDSTPWINGFFQGRHDAFKKDVEDAKSLSQEMFDSYEQENKDSFEGFSIGQTYEVLYESERFLSMEETKFEWLGTAHPNTFVSTYVFDHTTDKKLLLEDIVENNEEAKIFVADYIANIIKEDYDSEGFFEGYEEMLPDLYADDIFYLNDKGVVFVCNAYMIAPYAAGKMDFVIPYEEFTLLKEEYRL